MTRPPKQSSFLSPERRKLFAALLEKQGLDAPAQQPIPRRGENERQPLSFAQQRLWFIHQLDPTSSAYNLSLAVRLTGALDQAALQQALTAIVRRHEALRTIFPTVDSEPVQMILPIDAAAQPDATRMALVDLRAMPTDQREAEAQRLANHEARQPFDLARGPLLRARLLWLQDNEHLLLITMHHIVSDGWSLGIFVRELALFYESATTGRHDDVRLPALPIQYADFALWQRGRLTLDAPDSVLQTQLDYWQQQLAGAPPVLTLPTDRPRPPVQRFEGTDQIFTIAPPLAEALHELSRTSGTTLFMTMLAAWQVLLYRYSNQDDIVVSTGIANRNRPETEALIGCLINILLLRTQLAGDPRFSDVLAQVRRVVLEAQAHQDLPFEKLVDVLQPARDPSYSPLAQVMFVLHNAPAADPQIAGLKLRAVSPERVAAQYDLALHITQHQQGMSGVLEYNTHLFDRTTISRMLGHFQTLLTAIAARPEQRIGALPLLTRAEQQQMLVDWNATGSPYPARCLHQLFEAQAAQQPDALAAICGDERLSYAELNQRADLLASYLRSIGVGPNVMVGICMERSLDLVVGLLGILKAGGAYVPLDPAYPPERLRFMLQDTRAPVLLTQEHLRAATAGGVAQVVAIDTDWPVIAQAAALPPSTVTPTDLIYVIYTSGSTGRPKAVLLDHRGRVNNFCDFNRRFQIGPGDAVLALSSPSFDMSAYDVFGTLATGSTIVLPTARLSRDPAHWAELIERHRVTIWHSAPALLDLLLNDVAERGVGLAQSLRLTLLGGDWIPVALPDRLKALAPAVQVISLGGATEVSMDSTIYEIERTDPDWRSIPYGRPMANQRCYILDGHGQPTPIGIPGELHLGGDGVAWGYLNNPDLTAAKFVPDPFGTTGGRLYRTGDLARYEADGNIELLGRIDYQVKIRGLRIELGEIEAALREHPAIEEGVVVAREGPDGYKQLVAYIVGEPRTENQEPGREREGTREQGNNGAHSIENQEPGGGNNGTNEPRNKGTQPEDAADGSQFLVLGSSDLREFLRGRLPDYMIPAAFVVLPAFPLSPNGKLDRRALREIAPPTERDTSTTFVAPRTADEQRVAAIWAEVLGIKEIGIHDNFFELGGDSFKAIHVLQKLRGVALVDLFRSPTIEALAATMAAQRHDEPSGLLHRLSRADGEKTITLVCVPYGGGSAIVYQPLADALPSHYDLYALALPGHDFNREDEPLQGITETARACVAEIKAKKLRGPLILYGHCAGSATTVEIARLLEAAQIEISGIVLGGSLPGSRRSRTQSFLARLLPAERTRSKEQILAYLQRIGGLDDVDEAQSPDFVLRTINHDADTAREYLHRAVNIDSAPQLRAPIVCVMGDADPLTEDYQRRFREWDTFSSSVTLTVVRGGNHYFIKHHAQDVARIIEDLASSLRLA